MGLPLVKTLYPKTDFRLLPSTNSLNSDWVDANETKTGEVKINEQIRQAIRYNSPNDTTGVEIGNPERYCITEINNNKCVMSDCANKQKITYEFPNGEKYSILRDKKNHITRIRKFSEGKWKLISYETPQFSFSAEEFYSTIEKQSRNFLQGVKQKHEFPIGFSLKSLMPNDLQLLLKDIDTKGNIFDLRYLSKGEKELIQTSATSFGEKISKLAEYLFKFAKNIKL